jgi:putative membrane protein
MPPPKIRETGARTMSTLFAFLHHLCAFTLVSAIVVEFTLIRQELTLSTARRLQVTDLVLGIAAGALLVIGLLRVFFFEKGADYYFHSHAFTAKLSIFIAIGLLSIIPTREFLSWNKQLKAGQVPTVGARKLRLNQRGHSWRASQRRHYPALRRHHGAWWMGVKVTEGRIGSIGERELLTDEGLRRHRPSLRHVYCRLFWWVAAASSPILASIADDAATVEGRPMKLTR